MPKESISSLLLTITTEDKLQKKKSKQYEKLQVYNNYYS